jgi:hypothetical protein
MKWNTSLAAATAALLVIATARAGAQEGRRTDQANTIVVYGTGQSAAAPDTAYVSVGVVTQAKSAKDAAAENAKLTTRVIAAVKRTGLTDKDLQTNNYSVQPRYEARPNREPVITGYEVRNNVQAKIKKLTIIGDVIDAAMEAGANNVSGPSFTLDNRAEAEASALTDAVAEARRKAQTLAKAMGVGLGDVLQVHEGFSSRPMPVMQESMAMGRMAKADFATPIQTGELTVTANVTIVYRIR